MLWIPQSDARRRGELSEFCGSTRDTDPLVADNSYTYDYELRRTRLSRSGGA